MGRSKESLVRDPEWSHNLTFLVIMAILLVVLIILISWAVNGGPPFYL